MMVAGNTEYPLYHFNRSASLRVTSSYSLSFDLSGLPKDAKAFVETNLKKLGLTNLHGKPTFFAPARANKVEQVEERSRHSLKA